MMKEDLIALALQFRIRKLWESLDDSMIFAVKAAQEEIIYCCVMGHGGQHYALGAYRGASGFSTYLNMINRDPGANVIEMSQTFDCLKCDYENAGESRLSAAQKKLIKEVSAQRNIKMCRPKGYPEFLIFDRGLIRTELNQADIEYLGLALKAGIAVADRIKGLKEEELLTLGFDKYGTYPLPLGGSRIPMLEMQDDGSFKWSKTETPPMEDESPKRYVLTNMEPLGELRGLPRTEAVQCKVFHLQASVKCKEGFYNPLMMALVDSRGMWSMVMQNSDGPRGAEESVLNDLAPHLISMKEYPKRILVDDDYSFDFLSDLCEKANIQLDYMEYLPELHEAVYMMNSQFG